MRFFAWSFPHTAPIVVSRILRVSESSGHEPNSKDLQNKQGTDGGVLTGSSMLKLDREIESVNVSLSVVYFFTYPFVAIPSLFMKEEEEPLFIESG